MRALAGPAMLLVMFGGYAAYTLSGREDAPSRKFTELELAANDARHTGTCYSLSTVLIANGINGNTVRTWSAPDPGKKDEWMLTVESVVQGFHGPEHVFRKFTFTRYGQQVRLDAVDASRGLSTDPRRNIDDLLEGPHDMRSTPVDRCRAPGATGYQFPVKN